MGLSRILVAADESGDGRAAVQMGRSLARAAAARLSILEVLPSARIDGRPAGERISASGQVADPVLVHFVDWLGADGSPNGDVSPEVTIGFGLPGIEITRMAHEVRADLVVLGRRPRTPDRPLVLGETADAVLRRNEIPTLFVPPDCPELERVLIALDATDRSVEILSRGVEVSVAAGARAIGVVTVDTEADTGTEQRGPVSGHVLRVQQLVERFRRDAKRAPPISLETRRGAIVDQVLDAVSRAAAQLLVIGYRRGGPAKVVRPSDLARNLLYASATAVLTVPL